MSRAYHLHRGNNVDSHDNHLFPNHGLKSYGEPCQAYLHINTVHSLTTTSNIRFDVLFT